MFSIGEKVVCIHTFEIRDDYTFGVRHPKKGEIYTIRTINKTGDECYLRFEELRNPKLKYLNGFDESQYFSGRFRKLDYDFAEEVEAKMKEELLTEQL